MDALKLTALDEEDLIIFSAHMQDAVLHSNDMRYLPKTGQFVLTANRFIRETAATNQPMRRQTLLHFDRIEKASVKGLLQSREDLVLSLLAITFTPGDTPPHGIVQLKFSGGFAVRLDVECIEARLEDKSPPWPVKTKPSHDDALNDELVGGN